MEENNKDSLILPVMAGANGKANPVLKEY